MPFEKKEDLEEAIERIAYANKQTTMNATIREIQAAIKIELGYEPSTATISRVLKRLGIDNHKGKHSWQWTRKDKE